MQKFNLLLAIILMLVLTGCSQKQSNTVEYAVEPETIVENGVVIGPQKLSNQKEILTGTTVGTGEVKEENIENTGNLEIVDGESIINKYYYYLNGGLLQEAYALKYNPKESFETFKSWYTGVSFDSPVFTNQEKSDNYNFEVVMIENNLATKYNVTMQIKDGKLVTVSSKPIDLELRHDDNKCDDITNEIENKVKFFNEQKIDSKYIDKTLGFEINLLTHGYKITTYDNENHIWFGYLDIGGGGPCGIGFGHKYYLTVKDKRNITDIFNEIKNPTNKDIESGDYVEGHMQKINLYNVLIRKEHSTGDAGSETCDFEVEGKNNNYLFKIQSFLCEYKDYNEIMETIKTLKEY